MANNFKLSPESAKHQSTQNIASLQEVRLNVIRDSVNPTDRVSEVTVEWSTDETEVPTPNSDVSHANKEQAYDEMTAKHGELKAKQRRLLCELNETNMAIYEAEVFMYENYPNNDYNPPSPELPEIRHGSGY